MELCMCGVVELCSDIVVYLHIGIGVESWRCGFVELWSCGVVDLYMCVVV